MPVRRVEIPKDEGKKRQLGIPTMIDRMVQQVLSPVYEPTFSNTSYGFYQSKEGIKLRVHSKSIAKIRKITARSKGISYETLKQKLKQYVVG